MEFAAEAYTVVPVERSGSAKDIDRMKYQKDGYLSENSAAGVMSILIEQLLKESPLTRDFITSLRAISI